MKFPSIDRIGDWNPQLLRELNGRLQPRNVLIAVATSLLGQFFLFQFFQTQLPVLSNPEDFKYLGANRFCTGQPDYPGSRIYKCVVDSLGNVVINWQQWWLSVFVFMSFVGVFTLLVISTYMLIADLTQEERKGSLNFIRLSPESTRRLLIGKMLGVPILVYILAALAIPLHLWAGLSAQISLPEILAFYTVVAACCIFFFSAALLYGLVTNWLGGFQSWLGAGAVLSFLWLTAALTYTPIYNPIAWVRLFAPFDLIPHLADSSLSYQNPELEKLQWFHLPLGDNVALVTAFALVNYALWTYWVSQGLQRCFRNPHATILSKRQSYLFTACFTVSTLGFAIPGYTNGYLETNPKEWLFQHLAALFFFDLVLFLYLIAALLPHRQAMQDWARYRREKVASRKQFWNSSLLKDLIWGEKSPALVAICLNLIIAVIPLIGLVSFSRGTTIDEKIAAFFSIGLATGLVIIYAAIAQLILFMKAKNRIFWAIGTLGAALFLPPTILGILSIQPGTTLGFLWLFTVGAPIAVLFSSGSFISSMLGLAILGHWSILVLLSFQLTRQLRIAGESATKALLAGRI